MDKYLVIGNPIAHSKSPDIHQMFAQQTAQNISYTKQLVALDGVNDAVTEFRQQGFSGVNVTAPFKEQVMRLCDELSDRASAAAAVNTLWFKPDGTLFGDNTDGPGLVLDILRHNVQLKGANVLVIGAGGATRGVILPLLEQSPKKLTIANRTKSKAESLVAEFNAPNLDYAGLTDLTGEEFDVVINATSAGLSASRPDIDDSVVSGAVCYDMNYGKAITHFNQWASAQGARQVIDGLGMLVGQAAESFKLWREVSPDIEAVVVALRNKLEHS